MSVKFFNCSALLSGVAINYIYKDADNTSVRQVAVPALYKTGTTDPPYVDVAKVLSIFSAAGLGSYVTKIQSNAGSTIDFAYVAATELNERKIAFTWDGVNKKIVIRNKPFSPSWFTTKQVTMVSEAVLKLMYDAWNAPVVLPLPTPDPYQPPTPDPKLPPTPDPIIPNPPPTPVPVNDQMKPIYPLTTFDGIDGVLDFHLYLQSSADAFRSATTLIKKLKGD